MLQDFLIYIIGKDITFTILFTAAVIGLVYGVGSGIVYVVGKVKMKEIEVDRERYRANREQR